MSASQALGVKPAATSRRQGRRLGVGAARAVAAPERSVYETIRQNTDFPPETQFPWGFRPPQGFVLPHYTPRAPPSVPTPKQLGYTMPGEFERHAACWMAWPTSGYLWREGARPAQEQYAGIAKAISQFEPLKMIASPGADAELARSFFADAPNVEVVEIPIRDGWTRDWGPSFVARTEGGKRTVAGVHWDYDGYGATLKKLLGLPTFMPESDWAVDYDAGRKLIEHTGSRVFEAPIHIEGGSIHSDGEGCQGPEADHRQGTLPARHLPHLPRGRRPAARPLRQGLHAAHPRRAPLRLLHQPLQVQRRRRHQQVWRGRGGCGPARAGHPGRGVPQVPGPRHPGGGGGLARGAAQRRQRALHHPAAARRVVSGVLSPPRPARPTRRALLLVLVPAVRLGRPERRPALPAQPGSRRYELASASPSMYCHPVQAAARRQPHRLPQRYTSALPAPLRCTAAVPVLTVPSHSFLLILFANKCSVCLPLILIVPAKPSCTT
ncbi:hypothetical protein ABPG75_010048 [Micractinium tetrahymenae]